MKTSKTSMQLNIEGLSMCSPVDSLASHSVSRGNERALLTIDISGRKCLESLEISSQAGLLAKTFTALLVGTGEWYSEKCLLHWRLRVTKSGDMYCQLAVSALPTGETGSGLLPAPRVMEVVEHPLKQASRLKGRLGEKMATPSIGATLGLLPTPTSGLAAGGQRTDPAKVSITGKTLEGRKRQISLNDYIHRKLVPTPTATSDVKGGCTRPNPKRQMGTLAHMVHGFVGETGKTSQLNPRFVAEMMGFPIRWTEFPFLHGEEIP